MDSENVRQCISLIYNNKGESSGTDIIDYMITHALRSFIDYDDKNGKKYFATDFSGIINLREDPAPDLILFENIETEEDRKEAWRLAAKASKGARFYVPYGSDFLKGLRLKPLQRIYTYSASSSEANFCAYRTEKNDDGTMTVSVVYQPDNDGRRGLRNKLFEVKDISQSSRLTIHSHDDKYAINVVKAFAMGLSLSLEIRHITAALENYGLDGAEPEKRVQTNASPSRRRRKEEDFD